MKTELLYRQCFAYLWIDSEYDGVLSCRVTIEDLYAGRFTANSRDDAIAKFKEGVWKNG